MPAAGSFVSRVKSHPCSIPTWLAYFSLALPLPHSIYSDLLIALLNTKKPYYFISRGAGDITSKKAVFHPIGGS